MLNKHTPGPVGTSCLTCKRRRKKCDRARPGCERCATGGFHCLGYEHNDKSPVSSLDSPRDSSQREDTTDGGSTRSYRSPPLLFPDDTHLAIDNAWMMLSSFTPPSLKEQSTPATSASSISSNSPAPHLDCHIAQGGKECATFKQETSLFSDKFPRPIV
ncbi:hypothetical protein BDV93DRAFT_364052 [Ceratobasidium sp. AG-I]|nr:hypothetical protein BDV93DRAFT_364052 [Ceratobasidium sp. AG-I]